MVPPSLMVPCASPVKVKPVPPDGTVVFLTMMVPNCPFVYVHVTVAALSVGPNVMLAVAPDVVNEPPVLVPPVNAQVRFDRFQLGVAPSVTVYRIPPEMLLNVIVAGVVVFGSVSRLKGPRVPL